MCVGPEGEWVDVPVVLYLAGGLEVCCGVGGRQATRTHQQHTSSLQEKIEYIKRF